MARKTPQLWFERLQDRKEISRLRDFLNEEIRPVLLDVPAPVDAADIRSETLLRVCGAVIEGRIRDETKLGAYARAVARHLVREEARKAARCSSPPLLSSPLLSSPPFHSLTPRSRTWSGGNAWMLSAVS
jgi:DNA-directed RNA polymerase specialized sigma24 family protein